MIDYSEGPPPCSWHPFSPLGLATWCNVNLSLSVRYGSSFSFPSFAHRTFQTLRVQSLSLLVPPVSKGPPESCQQLARCAHDCKDWGHLEQLRGMTDNGDQAATAKAAQNAFVRAARTPSPAQRPTDRLANIGFDGTPLSTGGCPVVGAQPDTDGSVELPPGHPPLPTERQVSSIPNGADEAPQHQGERHDRWMYPSEQQFYKAMRRKGWPADPQDMKNVVAIHNGVNERAWHQILKYEALHDGCIPKLKRFMGRPQDYSPKARLLNILGYKLPFDRHDWVVDRCGREVRYVVDFYNASPLPDGPVAMHLDARPALDSFGALVDRLRLQTQYLFSGNWRRG